jgi:hypothetical protein
MSLVLPDDLGTIADDTVIVVDEIAVRKPWHYELYGERLVSSDTTSTILVRRVG